jgi:hypothetical protein
MAVNRKSIAYKKCFRLKKSRSIQQKILNPKSWIEDCTRFLGPQRGGAGRDHAARTPIHTGRSSGSWITLLPAPSQDDYYLPSGSVPGSSPITAAGPRRFLTVFPLFPLWDLYVAYTLNPNWVFVKGKFPGRGRKQNFPGELPGPETQDGTWPGGGKRGGDREVAPRFQNGPCPWPQ